MSTPENTFIRSVHRNITVYAEKTNNPYRGGTPDVYYEDALHLWVEYKFVVLPKRSTTLIQVELSELQKLWLRRCHQNTGRARVIVGCKDGGVVLETPQEWEQPLSLGKFTKNLLGRQALGIYIDQTCQI